MLKRAGYLVLLVAVSAWSASAGANEFEQAWDCRILPGFSLDDVRAVADDWQSAARSMQGGDAISVRLRWPIVVADSAERFEFVIRARSLEAWGAFYDRYDPDSLVGKVDVAFARVASCSGSTLWEIISSGEESDSWRRD